MVAKYPDWIDQLVDVVQNFDDPDQRVREFANLSQDLVEKSQRTEEWFSRGGSLQIPTSLFGAVERECAALGLPNRRAVLAIGRADNLETLLDDLTAAYFGTMSARFPPPDDLPFPSNEFAMIQVPRLEGGAGIWWPLILGHEIAHLKCIRGAADDFDIRKRLNLGKAPLLTGLFSRPKKMAAENRENAALRWAVELLCDAYTIFRFGPAGVASLSEFLDVNGDLRLRKRSHPPGLLRVKLALRWLGEPVAPALRDQLNHCKTLASWSYESLFSEPDLIDLAKRFEGIADAFITAVSRWPRTGAAEVKYESAKREQVLKLCIEDLSDGVPPLERYLVAKKTQFTREEDVINAGWSVRETIVSAPRLVSKSLDNLEFVKRWLNAGGKLEPEELATQPAKRARGGVVSEAVLKSRLSDRTGKRLVLTPGLDWSIGNAAIDIHLGTKFIVFRRSQTPSFQTLSEVDVQRMQESIEVGWGETFTLHPQEMALASTLEYVGLPPDLGAQVVTRSSYGRLGLITATAVQVHPGFRGVLTLELLNLGQVPLQLTPGERVGQLVFMAVSPSVQREDPTVFMYQIGPEFSRGRVEMLERNVLNRLADPTVSRSPST